MSLSAQIRSNALADPKLLSDILSEKTDRRIDILRRIADVGSISEAARSAGMSYKSAWQAVETLTNLAGTPIVEKVVGGANGGGTQLTATGRLIHELARARRQVLEKYNAADATAPGLLARATASSLQTSMRNQFPARITVMKLGAALVRLILRIDDTHLLKASVTKESAQLLGLREGMEVLALTKATGVEISSAFPEDPNAIDDNLIVGEVIRSERAGKGGECSIRLPSGIVIVGFAHGNHGLKLHDRAVAHIPPSSIVIAIAG